MADELFGNPTDPQATVVPETPQAPVEPAPAAAPVAVPAPDPSTLFADQLAGIMADDGRQKYVDVPTALASIPHAQDHIKGLNEKVTALESELAKKAGMEEVLQRINSQQAPTEPPSVPGLDETQAAQLVESMLTKREQDALEKSNKNMVINALTEKFGEKAEEMYRGKAQELGVAEGFLTEIAKRSPAAVMAYFGGAATPPVNPTAPGYVPPAQQPPAEDKSYMNIFKGGESDLVNKWRKAAKSD